MLDIVIKQALIISMAVLFIHATTWEGMIFQGIRKWISPDDFISKPIYRCPICMTPWWGTIIYLVFFNKQLWGDWFRTIAVAGGFSVISTCLLVIRDWAACAAEELEEKMKIRDELNKFKKQKLTENNDNNK